jgi:imidazolonepropionase
VRKVDLVIHSAAQMVTSASPDEPKRGVAMSDPGVIANGAVAISGGRIVGVGDTPTLLKEFVPDRDIDAAGKIVVPGLVDSHTHAVYAGNRIAEFEARLRGAGYLEIMSAGGGIFSTARATREASPAMLKATSRRNLAAMFSLGATTVEVKTGYGLDLPNELKLLEAIADLDCELPVDLVPTFMPAHAVPPEFKGRAADYVRLVIDEMLPAAADWYSASPFSREDRPCFVDVFCEQDAFSVEESQRVLEAGKLLGFAVKAHVDEFTNLGGVGMALRLGATSIDHLDTITPAEIRAIAESQTIAVLTPAVNFNLGSTRFVCARDLVDRGAAVALATDFNPGSAPCLSLPLVMGIACRYCGLSPAEALNAVTINAAWAVSLGARIGSIEVGKQADLLIADSDDFRELAYTLGGNPIQSVIKRGKVYPGNE